MFIFPAIKLNLIEKEERFLILLKYFKDNSSKLQGSGLGAILYAFSTRKKYM